MPRIRTIKPEFFSHEELYDLEVETGLPIRLAFAGLWTVCDREGRFKWRPRTIKSQTLPHDDLDFSRVLDALATRGFVVKYEHENQPFGWVPGFNKHQVINNREAASVLPEPCENSTFDACHKENHASGTRDPRVDHAGKGEGKGKEGKGKEGERKGTEGKTLTRDLSEITDYWNQSKASTQVRKLTSDRKAKLRARLADSDWPWREAIDCLPILNTPSFTWQPDFDWLIANERNAYSLVEGKYDRADVQPKTFAQIKQDNTNAAFERVFSDAENGNDGEDITVAFRSICDGRDG